MATGLLLFIFSIFFTGPVATTPWVPVETVHVYYEIMMDLFGQVPKLLLWLCSDVLRKGERISRTMGGESCATNSYTSLSSIMNGREDAFNNCGVTFTRAYTI